MNVIYLDDLKEHKISIVVCLGCLKRWIACRPVETKLTDLECPECSYQGHAIETGEEIEYPEGLHQGRRPK
jgi:hypothetical protein